MDVLQLDLSVTQIDLVGGAFSLAFAVFLGVALFLFLSRRDVARRSRTAVTISGVLVTIAAYHDWRFLDSFEAAVAGEALFNEADRYVDWVLTVPLLYTELGWSSPSMRRAAGLCSCGWSPTRSS
ncbi:MAG: bacteriorhodopsin [Nitriliruptoraceae bacterium]